MRVLLALSLFLYDKTAIAREETAPTVRDEFQRRTRIGAGNIQSLVWLSRLLWPDYGVISWTFWSHKVLRWTCPWLMLLAWVSCLVLADQPLYRALLWTQAGFYGLALLGGSVRQRQRWLAPGRIAWMFVMMNAALGCGLYRWLFRTQKGTWKRTERSATERLA